MVVVSFPEAGNFTIIDANQASGNIPTVVIAATPSTSTDLGSAVVPYFPLTGKAADVFTAVNQLSSLGIAGTPASRSNYPIYTPNAQDGGKLATYNNQSTGNEGESVTYYVPYRLPWSGDYDAIVEVVSRLAQPIPVPSQETTELSSPSVQPGATNSSSGLVSTSAINSPQATGVTAPDNGTKEDGGSKPGADGSSNDDDTKLLGASVGGTFGGIVFGVVGTFLVLWCLRRRRNRPNAKRTLRMEGSDRVAKHETSPTSNDTQVSDAPTSITGWQKHLPQEKDEKTISRTIKAIFDQVQMYTEDYYDGKPRKIDHSAIAVLGRVSTAGLTNMLTTSSNCIPVLEAILIGWIVHRISLRSDAGDSFLPFEYTKIPEQNGWHMESDDDDSGHVRETKKGFPQAFSQWRTLTVFLHPDPRADRDFRKQLDVKMDHGVRALTEAFSPWEKGKRNVGNRKESLRSILRSASEAGVMLFAQPSTFVFDWSTREGTITVSPAFVKRLDESAHPLDKPETLVAAKRTNI